MSKKEYDPLREAEYAFNRVPETRSWFMSGFVLTSAVVSVSGFALGAWFWIENGDPRLIMLASIALFFGAVLQVIHLVDVRLRLQLWLLWLLQGATVLVGPIVLLVAYIALYQRA